jgi:branched-chain amino acid transport system ATP-binding protein
VSAAGGKLLEVRSLRAWYGRSLILQGVDLEVGIGEIVCLTGRNGSGRSTTCRALMGLIGRSGEVTFDGRRIDGLAPHLIAQMGIGYVPEDRQTFTALTVRQNLQLGQLRSRPKTPWTLDDAFDRFSNLRERADVPAGSLSGGEQQMLCICRALMSNPRLLIVDEPTEGLAPALVDTIAELLTEIARRGTSVILVEQKLPMAMRVSSRFYVVGHGRTVFSGTAQELRRADDVRREWLEV